VSVRGNGCGRPYGGSVSSPEDAPIFASMVSRLQQDRAAAERHAEELDRLLADVEALHEPDADSECPTCGTTAPCPTLLLARGEVDYETACSAVRGLIDLTVLEDDEDRRTAPPMPRLADLLDSPTTGIDRFFDVLLSSQKD
jgi:hypothetical protein